MASPTPKLVRASQLSRMQVLEFKQLNKLTRLLIILNYSIVLLFSLGAVIGLPIIFLDVSGSLGGLGGILFGGSFGDLGLYLSYSSYFPVIYILTPIAILSIINFSLQLKRYSFSSKIGRLLKFGIVISVIYIAAVIIVNLNMYRQSIQTDPYYEPDSYPSAQQYNNEDDNQN